MFYVLDFKELITLMAEAKISTALIEVFKKYSRVSKTTNRGDRIFAFDALRLLEGVSETWRELHDALKDSREELLEENRRMLEEKNKPEKKVDYCLQKTHGG